MGRNCGRARGQGLACVLLGLGLGVILSLGPPVPAEAGFLKQGVRPSTDRLRTLKPPGRGARKRIYAPGERQQAAPAPTRRGRAKQQHAWFWKAHSVQVTSASSARWGQAVDTMSARRAAGTSIVGTGTLETILAAYRGPIAAAATRHNVSEVLILAVIAVESRGQPGAVSSKGAQGLMQLIPATAKRFGVSNAFDTGQNIGGGAAYLDWLLREFRGDPLLALAGYNAGEGAVRKHKGVPPYSETRDYVVKVMDAVAGAGKLCLTAPASPRARCQWRLAGG